MEEKEVTNYNQISKQVVEQPIAPVEQPNETVDQKVEEQTFQAEVVNCIMLNVRRSPNTAARILTVLSEGDKVTVKEIANCKEGWNCIQLEDEAVGFVMSEYIQEV
jgi:uncharacterized protein YgiM (DUF1202 family)